MIKTIKLNEKYVPIKDLTGGNVNVDNDISIDNINSYLINDLKTVSQQTGIKIQITTAKSDHGKGTKSGNTSRHYTNQAVDIAKLNGQRSNGASNGKNGSAQFRDDGNKIKDALVKLGYNWNSEGKSNPKVCYGKLIKVVIILTIYTYQILQERAHLQLIVVVLIRVALLNHPIMLKLPQLIKAPLH